jgi:tetratricopeptide (TPR) repeat protein
LNITNYRDLGGVRGTLQKHVEDVFQALSKPEQLVVQQIFLKVVEIGGDQTAETQWKPIRRRANRSEFENPLEQKMVVKLINENLLISSHETQSQASTIEIAHEVLLTSWTTLSTWIRDNRTSIALRNRLNNDVKLWQAKKNKDELWSGSKLAQVLDLRKDQTFNQVLGGFDREANHFIDASLNRRNHQRYRTIAIWTGFSTLALLSAALFISLGTTFIARFFNDRGYDEYLKNNPKKAMENYELALSIRADFPAPLLNMGIIYEDEQDFESAATKYSNAISLSMNKFTSAYSALARLYILQKKDQPLYTYEAIKLLETAWRLPVDKNLDRDYLEDYQNHKYLLLKNLGWAKLNLKLYSEAESYLNEAIALDAKRGSSYCLLAQVAEAKGVKQAAQAAWESCQKKGVEDNPDEKRWMRIAEEKIKNKMNNKDN